jgi:hypothetical protein
MTHDKSKPILPNLVRIAYNVQLSEREVISFETTVDQGASTTEYDSLLKKLVTVAERLKLNAAIEKLHSDRKQNEILLNVTLNSVDNILDNDRARFDASGRNGLYRQSREATNELNNVNITVARYRNLLETIEIQLHDFEGRLAAL